MSQEIIDESDKSDDDTKKSRERKNAELSKLNDNYSLVMRGSNVMIMREGINLETQAREISFLNKEAFLLYNQNKIVWIDKKKISVAKDWLEWKNRRQYDNLVFKPNQPQEIKSRVNFGDAGKQYNLWRGFSFEPQEGGKYDIFLDHLRTNLCDENEEHYQWVLAWLSDIFQRPNRKNGMALVMRGKQGVGKGVIASTIGKLCSKHYMLISQNSQITGKFNGHLADKILVFLDEPPWAGDKQAEGILRSLITEPILAVEHKGKDTITVDSYVRLIMATNHDWAVPVGMEDERRMAVFDVSERQKQNIPYFKSMLVQLSENDNSGYKALLHFFLNHKYDDATLNRLPLTQALLDQKQLSLPRHAQFWQSKLQDGLFNDENNDFRFGSEINLNTFYQSYLDFCSQVREMRPIEKQGLTKRLRGKFCPSLAIRESNGKRFIILPELKTARREFEEAIGQPINWHEGEVGTMDLPIF